MAAWKSGVHNGAAEGSVCPGLGAHRHAYSTSDDIAGPQAGDLLSTEPQLGQDCLSILPPLWRGRTQRIGVSTQCERLTYKLDRAKHGVLDRLYYAQMLHLRIVEYLI